LKPYLQGHTPDEIWADGTQVYHNVPFQVRQPDGSMGTQYATVKLAPTDPVPILDEAIEEGKDKR
jgi:hypothetical protein